MKLKENTIRKLKFDQSFQAKCAFQSFPDGNGLVLRVYKTGGKSWHYEFRFLGKTKRMTLGKYPAVSLSEARKRLAELKRKLEQGIDPIVERREEKEAKKKKMEAERYTFSCAYNAWKERKLSEKRKETQKRYEDVIKKHVLSDFGATPVKNISRVELLEKLQEIEKISPSTAYIAAICLKSVFDYALRCGYVESNVADTLTKIFKEAQSEKHYSALTDPKDVGGMLKKIEALSLIEKFSPQTRMASLLLPITGMRVRALCSLKWKDVDLESGTIKVEAEEGNKIKSSYTVYLPVGILAKFKEYASSSCQKNDDYCFPPARETTQTPYLRRETIKFAMMRAGIDVQRHSLHGWRQVLKTICSEAGVPSLLSEKMLGHSVGSKLEQTYNRSSYENALRKAWQWYEDTLLALKDDLARPAWQGDSFI